MKKEGSYQLDSEAVLENNRWRKPMTMKDTNEKYSGQTSST